MLAAIVASAAVGCAGADRWHRSSGSAGDGTGANAGELLTAAVVAFTEGPTVAPDGSVFFSDMLSGQILRYWPEGARDAAMQRETSRQGALRSALGGHVTTFREPSGGANGLIFDAAGRLVAAEIVTRRISRTDLETGEVEVLAAHGPATPIETPNDVTIDGGGRIYFTDLMGRRVYRIDPDGHVERILGQDEVEAPNGIVISPDDRILYLVEANSHAGGSRMIRAFDLREDGSVSNMRIFHDFSPGRSADGLSIDREGNVYAAAGLQRERGTSETLDTRAGIHVFAPDGRLIAFHPIPEDVVTNCAFGGKDMRTLYVTAGKTLFSVRTKIPGTGR